MMPGSVKTNHGCGAMRPGACETNHGACKLNRGRGKMGIRGVSLQAGCVQMRRGRGKTRIRAGKMRIRACKMSPEACKTRPGVCKMNRGRGKMGPGGVQTRPGPVQMMIYTNSPKHSDFEQKITKRTKACRYFLNLFVTFVFFCKIPENEDNHDQLKYRSIGPLVLDEGDACFCVGNAFLIGGGAVPVCRFQVDPSRGADDGVGGLTGRAG